ncbi:hypothetical protein QVD17_39783 [Tagetes erecta]|uniref:Uncharacterized protein n=1 Tax=Tagetes erecta TaxID=13708 RepID=A0AAD8JRE7_TARER|nr:hypothetical protein QVD17_39783 [Tagetes erecta]
MPLIKLPSLHSLSTTSTSSSTSRLFGHRMRSRRFGGKLFASQQPAYSNRTLSRSKLDVKICINNNCQMILNFWILQKCFV